MVCLIFIFLTPKSWLSVGERAQKIAHQSPVMRTVILGPEAIANEADRGQIEQQVKSLTARSKVEVLGVRRVIDANGKTVGFEVDIR